MKKIRALIADDHIIVRAGIRQFLESAADIEIVAEAEDGEQAKALEYLGKAVDRGMMVTARITDTYPWYTGMEGVPEYEAIQARMVDNINEQRALLGLDPIES